MSWRRVFTSEEAWIESLAGASPRFYRCERCLTEFVTPSGADHCCAWPMAKPPPFTPPDDEGLAEPSE